VPYPSSDCESGHDYEDIRIGRRKIARRDKWKKKQVKKRNKTRHEEGEEGGTEKRDKSDEPDRDNAERGEKSEVGGGLVAVAQR